MTRHKLHRRSVTIYCFPPEKHAIIILSLLSTCSRDLLLGCDKVTQFVRTQLKKSRNSFCPGLNRYSLFLKCWTTIKDSCSWCPQWEVDLMVVYHRSPPPLPPPLIPAEEFMFVLLSLPQTMGAPPSANNGAQPQSPLSVAPWDRFPETETKTSGWNPGSFIRKKAGYKMVDWQGGGAEVFQRVSGLPRQDLPAAAKVELNDKVRRWFGLSGIPAAQPAKSRLSADKDKDG